MKFLKRYYENTSIFRCQKCKFIWQLGFWKWFFFFAPKNDITRRRYVRCPRCGAKRWLRAKKVR